MTEEQKEKSKSKKWEAGGLMITAGLFIGMGIGWAFDRLVQGMFIGLGAGFLGFALILLLKHD
jgi:predicted histidine transporter YuiF (NhaC family)